MVMSHSGVTLLNSEVGPGVPFLNFERSAGVPLLNYSGVPDPTFKLYEGGSGSQGPKVLGYGVLVQLLHHASKNDIS